MNPQMSRRAAVALIAAASLSACSKQSKTASGGTGGGSSGPLSISLCSPGPNEAGFPMWLANRLGYFGDNKLKVKIIYAASGAALLGSGVAGQWQAGWLGSPPAITGYAKWGLISVGTMQHEDKNLKVVMPKAELEKSTPAQILATKKIGTTTNSTFSQVLYACAQHFGVDPTKLQIVPLQPPEVRQALQAGRVGAGSTDSSGDYDMLKSPSKYKIVCNGAIAGVSIVDPWVVTPKFAKEHPDGAAAFIEAGYRANEFITNEHDKAMGYILEYYKDTGIKGNLDAAKFSMSFREFPTLDAALKQMQSGATLKAMTATAQVFVEGGAYPKVPDLKTDLASGLKILQAAADLRSKRS